MRFLRSLTRVIIFPVLVFPVLIFAFQDKMIYHPRRYPQEQLIELRQKYREVSRVSPLDYATPQGPQRCYYVPPASGTAQGNLWVLFNGNGSLALDWMYLLDSYPAASDAFLLVEYPGYGACKGHPSSKAIQESADAALAALAGRLGVAEDVLEPHLATLGHSLGCAAALGFAARHPVGRVVLLAPFTSMEDMARRTVGTPLCYLLADNYDNRARLREIAARPTPPRVEIFSGTRDHLIPSAMGRELADLAPGVARFTPVEGAGHNDILGHTGLILPAMTGEAGPRW
ncbi:MAG: alpha/beta hydrolase [Chthoniobacteraceae bacterium]